MTLARIKSKVRHSKPFLAFLALVVAFTIVTAHFQSVTNGTLAKTNRNVDTTRANTNRIALIQQRSCVRAQVQLANDNASHLTDFRFFHTVIDSIKTGEANSKDLYVVLHIPPKDIALIQAANKALITRLLYYADQKTWIPLSSCVTAGQTNGQQTSTFIAPEAIPFYKRLPPRSDLVPPPSS